MDSSVGQQEAAAGQGCSCSAPGGVFDCSWYLRDLELRLISCGWCPLDVQGRWVGTPEYL